MAGLPFLAVGILMSIVAVIFMLISLVLIFIVLLQRGKGGGLSSVLGGGMASGLLGSKTGDVLTWVTIVLAGLFLLVGFFMAKYYKPSPTEIEVPAPISSPQPSSTAPGVAETPVETDQPIGGPAGGPNSPAQ